jgi:polysaccharide biosynthesis protein PslH
LESKLNTRKPRILYVTPAWPGETPTGVHVRSLNVLRALQQIGTVEAVHLAEHAETAGSAALGAETRPAYRIPVMVRPNKGITEALLWALDPKSNYPFGCRVGPDAVDLMRRTLNDFDVVWFFKARSADVFPNTSWARSVLDIDDLESRYEHSNFRAGGSIVKQLLTRRRQFAWRRRERLFGERFTVITVCSEGDREYLMHLGLATPIHVIPNGFERPTVEPDRNVTLPPRIGFMGPLGYFPNRDGIHWFVKECWPRVKAQVPDARLRLVGPETDGALKPQGADIDGLGWLPVPSEEIKTWSLMIVPIRVGGGTRVKIAYAFSQKCPLVSTSLGAYGYQVQNGCELYLADSAEAFAHSCIAIIEDPQMAARMAELAWSRYLEKWTWDAIYPRIWAAVEDCMRRGGSASDGLKPVSGAESIARI